MSQFNATNYPTVTPGASDLLLIRRNSDGTVKTATVASLANASTPILLAATIAELKAIDVGSISDGAAVQLGGYYELSDGGGGEFYYDAFSAASDNGGTVIAPSVGAGRWIRNWFARLSVLEFGAKGDGVTNDAPAIQGAIDAVFAGGGGLVYIPAKPTSYRVTATILLKSDVTIEGDGDRATLITANLTAPVMQTDVTAYSEVSANRRFAVRLRDFRIDNTSKLNANGVGVDWAQISTGEISNIALINCETALRVRNVAYYNRFEKITISTAITGIKIQNQANENWFHDMRVVDTATGVHLYDDTHGLTNINFAFAAIEGFTTRGIYVETTAPGMIANANFISPRIENSGGVGIGIEVTTDTDGAGIISPYFVALASDIVDPGDKLYEINARNSRLVINNVILGDNRFYSIGSTVFLRNSGDTVYRDLSVGQITSQTSVTTATALLNMNDRIWRTGAGSPEGAVAAQIGSLYTRTDGGANTTLYVKESGVGTNTGWVAK